MALNIITAKFCSGATQAWASEAWQYDYGQVLQFDGIDLPEAYQVHFSNKPMTGKTITQIGNVDGVSIPDQFFQNGEPIFAWVYLHEGEDDGETVYMVTIPVKKRPQPSDEVPTPVEQSAIDQAIAALNIAVEKADEAITHYPTIINGTWHVWDVTAEEYADTGVQAQGAKGDKGDKGTSPTITVTDITDGHRVTITDVNGTKTFDVMNGAKGDPGTPGAPGTPGDPGFSPTVTVTEITGGHRVTITDASGTHTFDVMDGEDGTTPTVDSALSLTSENPVKNKVITQEVTNLKDNLNQKADVIISTASGSIAHFEDGAEADAVSVTAHIEPVQDLHGYDSPWPAGGGANLLPFDEVFAEGWTNTEDEITATYSKGYMRVTGTNTTSGYATVARFRNIWQSSRYEFGAGDYAIPDHLVVTMAVDGRNDANKEGVVTANTSISVRGFYIVVAAGATVDWNIPMIFTRGTTIPDTYFPYSNICPISGFTGMDVIVSPTADVQDGTTYPITFPTEAGTVYGGHVDVTTGKLVVDRANITNYSGQTLPGEWISDRDTYTPGGTPSTGAQVVYELATPIEYDITPQQIALLKGYNNVWNNACGNTEVQYKADTKLYIDNLLGTTEDDMTANANIASGKFFSVGNRLFLSTAAIAQGATIVPGTNCTELTISEALNQVNA